MNDVTEEIQPNEEAEQIVLSPGEMVREQREAANISHTSVADALHLTVHYVKALENNEYSKLPGLTFVKGYFRAYARFLQMDVDAVMSCYEEHLAQLGEIVSEKENSFRMRRRNDQVILWAVVAGVVTVIALALGWWLYGRTDSESRTQIKQNAPRSQPAADPGNYAIPRDSLANTNEIINAEATPAVAANTDISTQTDQENDLNQTAAVLAEDTEAAAASGLLLQEAVDPLNVVDESAAPSQDVAIPDPQSASAPFDMLGQAPVESADPVQHIERQTSAAGNTTGLPAATLTAGTADTLKITRDPAGGRNIEVVGEGVDMLRLAFSGTSWVEIDDATQVRLYNDLLVAGDKVTIRGGAPFFVLLGDATQVKLHFNDQAVNIGSSIRSDKTARIELSETGVRN